MSLDATQTTPSLDERIRHLESRFRITGADADEAAWLRERVVAGHLERSRLELAAYLGHEAARLAGGDVETPDDLHAFVEGCGAWGNGPLFRATLILAEVAVDAFEAAHPDDDRPRRALVATREAARREEIIDDALWEAAEAAQEAGESRSGDSVATFAAAAASFASRYIGMTLRSGGTEGLDAPTLALTFLGPVVWSLGDLEATAGTPDPEGLRALIRETLVPWALGADDPIG